MGYLDYFRNKVHLEPESTFQEYSSEDGRLAVFSIL